MNKWQILSPLAAMAIAILVLALLHHHNRSYELILVTASHVGDELVAKTNSAGLTSLSTGLRSNLVNFLAATAKLQSVQAEPDDNGKPAAIITLVNDAGQTLAILLRWEQSERKFSVPSYAYVTHPPQTNSPSQSSR